jgi:mannosyltransferase
MSRDDERRMPDDGRRAGLGLIVAMALIVLAAFALRVYRLDAQSVWYDEGWSWHLARLPLDQMVRETAADRSPVLYYALLHGWIELAGQSEFAMRFLSVCADVGAVALVIAMARSLSRRRWGAIVAGMVYTLCPFALWYAQETRMYALVAALCLGSSYWLWRWLRAPVSARPLIASAALLALAVHSHYYAIFLLPAQGVAVLLLAGGRSRQDARGQVGKWAAGSNQLLITNYARWLLAAAAVIALLVPWLLVASAGFAYDDGFVFPLNTVAGRMAEWVTAFAGGGLARELPIWWAAALALATLAGGLCYAVARRWRALLFVLVLVIGPLLVATVAVRLVYPYRSVFHPRYLIYIAPVACLLIGGMADGVLSARVKRPLRRWWLLALPALSLAGLAALWLPALQAMETDSAVARDDVRAATRHVVEALQPGDLVVMTRDNYAVRYYLDLTYPAHQGAFIAAPEGLHGILRSDEDFVRRLRELNPERVRLMLWQDEVVDPQRLVESTLWAQGYEIGEIDFGQMRLPLYQLLQHPPARIDMQPVRATFGATLDLVAYWMPRQGLAGNWFYAVLAWSPRQTPGVNYKVFVQVWDADNKVVFQRDKLPLNDLLPMTSWTAGDVLRDPYAMVIPAALPAGTYRVAVGVYDPGAGTQPARLAARAEGYPVLDDAVILGTLKVQTR